MTEVPATGRGQFPPTEMRCVEPAAYGRVYAGIARGARSEPARRPPLAAAGIDEVLRQHAVGQSRR